MPLVIQHNKFGHCPINLAIMSTKTKKSQAAKAKKTQYKGTKRKKKSSSRDGFLRFVLQVFKLLWPSFRRTYLEKKKKK